jgi:hypothetical protein
MEWGMWVLTRLEEEIVERWEKNIYSAEETKI